MTLSQAVLPIAVSVGCPCGIGPEISILAARDLAALGMRLILVGDHQVLQRAAALHRVSIDDFPCIAQPAAIGACSAPICIHCPTAPLDNNDCRPGFPSQAGGRAQLAWVDAATDLVVAGVASAIVTGPVSKDAIARSGAPGAASFRGHTEHIAARVGATGPVMIFVAEDMAVALVTTHLPLARVAEAISVEGVVRSTLRCAEIVARLGKKPARIVVAALNPHAGEHRLLGTEDDDIIAPAVEQARAALKAQGMDARIDGPTPAEAAFRIAFDGGYDGVVAMYHDQGTIPRKVRYFGKAVNVTAGLPIVRTSVDHGTAYDIAGTGKAEASSMVEAMKLAGRLAKR